MSDLELNCIESWKKNLPNFQIKRWDESNFDYKAFGFSRDAYKLKKYAFVSDVCRLFALYHDGGIYLDTDMMVLKDFSPLLYDPFFVGEENEGVINAAIIGSEMKSEILKSLLDGYRRMTFDFDKPLKIPIYLSSVLEKTTIRIYPSDFFYALPFRNRCEDFHAFVTPNSLAVHLWNYSWRNEWSFLHEKKFRKSWEQYLSSVKIRGFKRKDFGYLVALSKFWLAYQFPSLYQFLKEFRNI